MWMRAIIILALVQGTICDLGCIFKYSDEHVRMKKEEITSKQDCIKFCAEDIRCTHYDFHMIHNRTLYNVFILPHYVMCNTYTTLGPNVTTADRKLIRGSETWCGLEYHFKKQDDFTIGRCIYTRKYDCQHHFKSLEECKILCQYDPHCTHFNHQVYYLEGDKYMGDCHLIYGSVMENMDAAAIPLHLLNLRTCGYMNSKVKASDSIFYNTTYTCPSSTAKGSNVLRIIIWIQYHKELLINCALFVAGMLTSLTLFWFVPNLLKMCKPKTAEFNY